MLKNAQDRMDLTKKLDFLSFLDTEYDTPAHTHGVQVVLFDLRFVRRD